MIIKDNKIIECTESELFEYYLTNCFDDLFSFSRFKELLIKKGTKINV